MTPIQEVILYAKNRLEESENELKVFINKYEGEIDKLGIGIVKEKWTGEREALKEAQLSKLEKEKEKLKEKVEGWRTLVTNLEKSVIKKGKGNKRFHKIYFVDLYSSQYILMV